MPLPMTSFPSIPQFDRIFTAYINDVMAGLLFFGALLLTASLYFVYKLTRELRRGSNRNWWKFLAALILLFICGYIGFYWMKLGVSYTVSEMLVPIVFFLGAVFVLLVCFLAYLTTCELKRIFVLEQETITDPLMGIFNRRHLDRRLQEEVIRCQRYNLLLTVLMVDIDHFKTINDTWGHQIGDLVLKHVSRIFTDSLRQTDMIARFGGEEFVIMLPHTSAEEAYKLAERLRKTVEKTPLTLMVDNNQNGLPVTISIGCASLLADDDSAYALLERADKAMYHAKLGGRNRVVRCGEGEAPGSSNYYSSN